MTTIFLRYLDVCLVLATAPFVLAAGLPVAGYVIGATAWLATRIAVAALQARSLRSRDPKVRAGLQVGTMMARVWIIALAVVLARYAGSKGDGIMAAALVLAAFTVYFVLNIVMRGGQLQGRPSTS
ncbi:MAG TPA: hypothetical protein VGY76_14510 [Solirubrobacteraceae bacterium]|jgi:hypothetical protein|nr:hypothetical protein [Solirubrobacteraceae bacterium]